MFHYVYLILEYLQALNKIEKKIFFSKIIVKEYFLFRLIVAQYNNHLFGIN